MLRVEIERALNQEPVAAQLKRPPCQLCKGGGYLLADGERLPPGCTYYQLASIALPCGCQAGDEFRKLAVEISKPTTDRYGRQIDAGVQIPWL